MCTTKLCFIILNALICTGKSSALFQKHAILVADKSLVLTNVIFRHGERAPDALATYPNMPYPPSSYSPYNPGDLTIKGQTQMIKVGGKLKLRYGHFLGDTYFTNLISSYTSNYDRTQMSLQAVHAGLFMTNKQNPIPGLYWQAIPYTNLGKRDKLIAPWLTYPELYLNFTEPIADVEILNVYDYIKIHAGFIKEPTTYEAWQLYDYTLGCRDLGLAVPEWVKPIFPQLLAKINIKRFREIALENMARGCGFLLKKISDDMVHAVTKPGLKKMFLYSGHDLNMHYLLTALGVWFPEEVGNGAYIMFELYNYKNVYGVKVYYDNNYYQPKLLEIPDCGTFCRLDTFLLMTSEIYEKIDSKYK